MVSEERWQGQFFETKRHETVALDPETLAALLAMIDQRAAAFAAAPA